MTSELVERDRSRARDVSGLEFRVWADVENFGRRIGVVDRDGDGEPPAGGTPAEAATAPPAPAPEPVRKPFQISMPRCFGCLLALLCGRRLAPA